MELKINLDLIKEVGLNAAAVFSYLNEKRNNIKPDEFFNVKLKELEKELSIKRYSLKDAIYQLEKGKLVEKKAAKSPIVKDVRFRILRNEKPKNSKTIARQVPSNSSADFCDGLHRMKRSVAYFCDGQSQVPSNSSVKICDGLHKAGVKIYDGKHKRRAPSICPVNIINNIKLRKRKKEQTPSGFVESPAVRKNPLNLKIETGGTDIKQPTPPLIKKPVLKLLKDKTNTKAKGVVSEAEKATILAQEILEYLNKKAGKKFKISAESNLKNIRARISEGYTLENLKEVIDKKSSEWSSLVFSDGKPASNYLRPSTLFASKNFENYLNEEPPNKIETGIYAGIVPDNPNKMTGFGITEAELLKVFIKSEAQPQMKENK